jgi:DNA gyrase subunit B
MRLPTHRITWRGGDRPAWSEAQAHELAVSLHVRLAETAVTDSNGTAPIATIRELHENRELEKIFSDLAVLGLEVTPDSFAGVQGEAVTGERLPARFAWVTNAAAGPPESPEADGDAEAGIRRATSKVVEAPNLMAILEALKDIGRRGLEIKRFKGLGEMDAEQLWETTMDPTRRTFMKVTWDMGSAADAMFTVLMGEEVEPRRRFIEEHALEVRRLDV